MQDVLKDRFRSMVVTATNEATDPTIDSQIVQLQATGADVLICGVVPRFDDVDTDGARRIVEGALRRGEGWLTSSEAQALMAAMRIATAGARLVASEADAMEAARVMGYPVVLKAVGPEIVHKTEVGGVVLDLRDEAAVSTAYRSMAGRLGATMTGAVLQQMVTGGVELLVGAVVDPTFGPLVACGSGGVLVEIGRAHV